jgi:hypothetical protein
MIYRGTGILEVVRFASSPTPSPPRQQIVSLSQSFCMSSVELTEVGGSGMWREPNHTTVEKVWSCINNSILSVPTPLLHLDLISIDTGGRIHRPSFRENKLKTLVSSHWKLAFWACFCEKGVCNFGHGKSFISTFQWKTKNASTSRKYLHLLSHKTIWYRTVILQYID